MSPARGATPTAAAAPDRRPGRDGERPTAYRASPTGCGADIAEHRYPPGQPLPTESQLSQVHGVSRQTVRRAFQDLVADGLVYRVPGRHSPTTTTAGTCDRPARSRISGSALDTELEMLSSPAVGIDIEAASRLRLETDEIVRPVPPLPRRAAVPPRPCSCPSGWAGASSTTRNCRSDSDGR